MTEQGYYDTSLPPSLLVGARRQGGATPAAAAVAAPAVVAAQAGAAAQRQPEAHRPSAVAPGGQPASPRLAATSAGYVGPVRAGDRPRNLGELTERVELWDESPWPAGTSLAMGERGRRAHWTGSEWRGGISPGYPAQEPAARHAAPEQPATPPPPPPYTAYPADRRTEDLTR